MDDIDEVKNLISGKKVVINKNLNISENELNYLEIFISFIGIENYYTRSEKVGEPHIRCIYYCDYKLVIIDENDLVKFVLNLKKFVRKNILKFM